MQIRKLQLATAEATRRMRTELKLTTREWHVFLCVCEIQSRDDAFVKPLAISALRASVDMSRVYDCLETLRQSSFIELVRKGKKFTPGASSLYCVAPNGRRAMERYDRLFLALYEELCKNKVTDLRSIVVEY